MPLSTTDFFHNTNPVGIWFNSLMTGLTHRNINLEDSYYAFKILVFCFYSSYVLILVIVNLQAYVDTLEVRVKEHEDYNSDLQEGEKWLLHMSSRLVSPDLMESNNLEIITQQLANHKVGLLLW